MATVKSSFIYLDNQPTQHLQFKPWDWHLVMCLKIELLQKPMEKTGRKTKRNRTDVISIQFPTSEVSLLTDSGVLSQELGQLDLCFLEGLCLWTISCPLTDASLGFTMLNLKPSLAELMYLTIDLTRYLFGKRIRTTGSEWILRKRAMCPDRCKLSLPSSCSCSCRFGSIKLLAPQFGATVNTSLLTLSLFVTCKP